MKRIVPMIGVAMQVLAVSSLGQAKPLSCQVSVDEHVLGTIAIDPENVDKDSFPDERLEIDAAKAILGIQKLPINAPIQPFAEVYTDVSVTNLSLQASMNERFAPWLVGP